MESAFGDSGSETSQNSIDTRSSQISIGNGASTNMMRDYQAEEAKKAKGLTKRQLTKQLLGAGVQKIPGVSKVANSKFVRGVGDKAKSVKEMAGRTINKIPQPVRRSIRGVRKAVGRQALQATKGAARFAGRATVAAGGLALGGIAGIAAGITGDDMEDVFKMGAAGAGIGMMGSSAIGNKAASLATGTLPEIGRQMKQDYDEGAYGKEEAALRAQQRELMNDEAYEKTVTMELSKGGNTPSKSEIRQAMRTGTEYYNAGITNYDDIMKAMETEQSIRNELQSSVDSGAMSVEEASMRARNQAKVVAKFANKVTASDLRNQEQTTAMKEAFKTKLRNSGMNEGDATKQADRILNLVKKQKGI